MQGDGRVGDLDALAGCAVVDYEVPGGELVRYLRIQGNEQHTGW